jgi:photosystem II stability/assembly factor-like uncharacterized protein
MNYQQTETKMTKSALLLAGVALVVYSSFGYSQITSPAPMPTAVSKPVTVTENNGTIKTEPAAQAGSWVNVSESFTKEIGVEDIDIDIKKGFRRRCNGLIVTPDGDLVMQTSTKGICVSKNQGATWSVVADNKILGRCTNGLSSSLAYPYDGRMAFFCFDGKEGASGGISLDGAKTWSPFTNQVRRGTEFGDIDWKTPNPQIIFAVTHEPYFSVLSNDGGKSWQRIDEEETGSKASQFLCVGVIDSKTLTRYNPGKKLIELSNDAGQTWTQVAECQVQGHQPVHYGQKVYWTTTKGVIMSTNGKDWTLTGPGAEGAVYGPYFGSSDQEFVVVTDKDFLKTVDGGKTWKSIAKFYKAPDIFHGLAVFSYFGWDPKHNILYASGLGASIYKLQLEGAKTPDDGRGVQRR